MDTLIIGSRKSPLAMAQSNLVRGIIERSFPGIRVEIEEIITKGDKIQSRSLSEIGGKGLFTEELEKAILNESVDLAVHSLKDLPTKLPQGLCISAYIKREEPRDCLVSNVSKTLTALPVCAVVGTSSLRRRSQILSMRSDIKVVDLRGNVETRLKKLETEKMDAIIIAAAGLIRLGLGEKISELFSPEFFLPAVGQGIIAVESKSSREDLNKIFGKLNDRQSEISAITERALLYTFEGGCQIPVAALSTIKGDELFLNAYVGSIDGKKTMRRMISGKISEAKFLGERLAKEMLRDGAQEIIREIRNPNG